MQADLWTLWRIIDATEDFEVSYKWMTRQSVELLCLKLLRDWQTLVDSKALLSE